MATRTISTRIAIDGEAQYRQAMTAVNAELKKYGSALNLVQSQYKTNANSIEALRAKEKALADLQTAQTAKIKELNAAYKNAQAAVDTYKDRKQELTQKIEANEAALEKLKNTEGDTTEEQRKLTEETTKLKAELAENEARLTAAEKGTNGWETSLNKAQVELNDINDEIKKNDKYLDEARKSTDKTAKSIDNLGNETKKSFSKIKYFANSTVGLMATIAGAFALAKKGVQELWRTFDDAANWADELATLSNKTGITTDTLQEMAYAARFVDVELGTMQKGLSRIVMGINEAKNAGNDYIETAGGLKISLYDVNGNLKESEELFYNAVDAIGAMANETEREAAAQDIFGRSYQDLMPLIREGSGALKEYGEEAREAGVIVSSGMVAALQTLDDKMERSSAKTETNGRRIAAVMSDVGMVMDDLKYTAENFVPLLQYKIWYEGTKLLSGATDETMTSFESLKVGASAAGVDIDTFSQKVSDMTGVILVSSGGAKTWDEAYSEAYSNVVMNIDSITYAQDQMTAAQGLWDEQVNAALDSYITKRAEYEQAVATTAEAYLSDLGGLFDGFDAQLAGSQEELDKMTGSLLGNLQSQVDGIEGWADEMEKLSKRGIDEGLLQELRDMGPDAYAQIQALNNATDGQLKEYEGLYKTRSEAAREAAKTALEPMAQDVADALKAAETVIEAKNSDMERLGKQLALGIGDGIDAGTWYVKQSAKKAVEAAIQAAKTAGRIESPSKLMRDEVGVNLGQGMGDGWLAAIEKMSPKIEESMKGIAKASAKNISIEVAGAAYIANAEVEKANNKKREDYYQERSTVKMHESGNTAYDFASATNDAYSDKMKELTIKTAPITHKLSWPSERQESPARLERSGDINISVDARGMIVRNDSDIKKISQNLAEEAQRKIAAKGGVRG